MKYIELSTLRILAVLLIVNSHLSLFYNYEYLATGGAIGNAIFFLISGIGLSYSLSKKKIAEIIPILSLGKIYVGNDSFGHHVTSQRGIPSFVIMLDTPRAYTDYSKKCKGIKYNSTPYYTLICHNYLLPL